MEILLQNFIAWIVMVRNNDHAMRTAKDLRALILQIVHLYMYRSVQASAIVLYEVSIKVPCLMDLFRLDRPSRSHCVRDRWRQCLSRWVRLVVAC